MFNWGISHSLGGSNPLLRESVSGRRGSADLQSISISQNRCTPRRFSRSAEFIPQEPPPDVIRAGQFAKMVFGSTFLRTEVRAPRSRRFIGHSHRQRISNPRYRRLQGCATIFPSCPPLTLRPHHANDLVPLDSPLLFESGRVRFRFGW